MTPTDIRDTAIPADVMETAGFVADGMDDAVRELKWGQIQNAIARAIMAATEAERERCAQTVEDFTLLWGRAYKTLTDEVAAAIRAGTKGETP